MTGWKHGSPKRAPTRIRSAGSSAWSRNTSTAYSRNARRISRQASSSGPGSDTPRISAPSAPASGSIIIGQVYDKTHCHRRRGSARRLCRRHARASRARRDADRRVAGADRDHPGARSRARRHDARGALHGEERQDHAPDRGPVARRAAEGDAAALAEVEALIVPKAGANPRGDIQRPSMAQDILKGRRTEIDAMNGYIARKGAEVGVPAPSHARLAEIVTRVERGELAPSPSHLEEICA